LRGDWHNQAVHQAVISGKPYDSQLVALQIPERNVRPGKCFGRLEEKWKRWVVPECTCLSIGASPSFITFAKERIWRDPAAGLGDANVGSAGKAEGASQIEEMLR
jgi:hypothetical protein